MATRTVDPGTKDRLASHELGGGFWTRPKKGASRNALAESGLAHESKRFALGDFEAHTVDGVCKSSFRGEPNPKPPDGK